MADPHVKIKWLDATQHDSLDTLDHELTPWSVTGWAYRKTEDVVTLYSSKRLDGEMSQNGPFNTIPVSQIVSVHRCIQGAKIPISKIPMRKKKESGK